MAQAASRHSEPIMGGEMAALAAMPQIFCKLSGLVTETAVNWTPAALQPYVTHPWRCSGRSG